MDQERTRNMVTNAAEKISGTASDTAEQVGANMKDTLDQGKAIARDVQAGVAALGRQASEAGQQAMAQAGEVIQGAAREAGKQATPRASNGITLWDGHIDDQIVAAVRRMHTARLKQRVAPSSRWLVIADCDMLMR